MKHLEIFENFGGSGYNYQDGKKIYTTLNPGQISHFRQVFRMMPAKDVEYASKVLDTIEKKGGKCSVNQWNVLMRTKNGGNYPVNY
jgi:hypothetical protein